MDEIAELQRRLDTLRVNMIGASSLTSAELRLLPLLATHLTFPKIGERLFISPNTVKAEAISIYRKLGVSSRGEAIERAQTLGLLAPGALGAPLTSSDQDDASMRWASLSWRGMGSHG